MHPGSLVSEHPPQDPLVRARAFEAAGDESVYESAIEEAKVNYGWAIDTFLEGRAFEEAIRICRKLIRLSPDVVRTRYSLLFLLIGLGRYEEARAALEDYVRVVHTSGTRSFAIPRLQVTEDDETLARIEAILTDLGSEQLGFPHPLVRDHLTAEATAGADRTERWETLLPIALRDD
jgi:tetratricopeptide (TPR) repeat protein